jgi:excinuclease ABC subunit B
MTDSMKRAIDETDRRRAKQVEYNIANNITPATIVRKVMDIMEGARSDADADRAARSMGMRRVAEPAEDYALLSPTQLVARLKKLEAQMYKHAQNLEFEDAARVRDEMKRVREATLLT